MSKAHIKLENVFVEGVNTAERAASLRHAILRRKSMIASKIPIINGISLEIKEGEKVGIIGKNGSGKSSLLKVIAGIYPAKSGKVEVHGKVAPLIEMGIGFDEELSGKDNIKLALVYSNRLKDYSQAMVKRIIEFTELGDKINVPLKTYSSGMKARLAFAVAVFQTPDILLLDEVFAVGDSGFVKKSENFMKEKLKSVPIAIMVNHAPAIMISLCDRCIYVADGKIVADGNPKKVLKLYQSQNS
jgi:lipopolysaccharide transport system ATP-binding protein